MESNDILLYLSELTIVREMLDQGIIDEADFKKAEAYLARKHCIKDKSIYRLNELIIDTNNVMNIGEGKEEENDSNNEDRTAKKVIEIT